MCVHCCMSELAVDMDPMGRVLVVDSERMWASRMSKTTPKHTREHTPNPTTEQPPTLPSSLSHRHTCHTTVSYEYIYIYISLMMSCIRPLRAHNVQILAPCIFSRSAFENRLPDRFAMPNPWSRNIIICICAKLTCVATKTTHTHPAHYNNNKDTIRATTTKKEKKEWARRRNDRKYWARNEHRKR